MANKSKKGPKPLAVASRVKDYVRENGYFAGTGLVTALSDKIQDLLDDSFARAKSNGRRTVRAGDI